MTYHFEWDAEGIKNYLEKVGVDYKASGKNVARHDVNIDCPYCSASKHLGVSSTGATFCRVCEFEDLSRHPSLIRILHDLTGETFSFLIETAKQYSSYYTEHQTGPQEDAPHNDEAIFPSSLYLLTDHSNIVEVERNRQLARQYLLSRRFDPDEIADKYSVTFSLDSKYYGRLIVPAIEDGVWVNWLGRDYTGRKGISRYLNCDIEGYVKPFSAILYGAEHYRGGTLYVVEGVTDMWRLGPGSVAILKSKVSARQEAAIKALRPSCVCYVLDEGATWKAYASGERICDVVRDIRVVKISGPDVADRDADAVKSMAEKTPPQQF
jgi:hypothetical protein